MKQLFSILLIAILSAIATAFFPWWMVAIVTFSVVALVRPTRPFLIGFAGVALFWLALILMRDIPNQHILSQRMSKLFSLPHYSIFIIVDVLLGGLVGGLAAWSAAAMRKLF